MFRYYILCPITPIVSYNPTPPYCYYYYYYNMTLTSTHVSTVSLISGYQHRNAVGIPQQKCKNLSFGALYLFFFAESF